MIPKSFRLGAERWKVKVVRMEPETWGECRHDTQTICLNSELKGDVLEAVFVHEIVHSCCGTQIKGKLTEEEFVEIVAPRLWAYLKQNRL